MNLEDLRKKIDETDTNIVRLIGERLSFCREVAALKQTNGLPMMQPHRLMHVRDRYVAMARQHGVDGDFARRLSEAITAEACRIELVEMGEESSAQGAAGGSAS